MYDHIIPKRVTIHKLSKSTLTVYIMSQRLHSDAEWFEILIKSKNELLNFDLFWCLFSSFHCLMSEAPFRDVKCTIHIRKKPWPSPPYSQLDVHTLNSQWEISLLFFTNK